MTMVVIVVVVVVVVVVVALVLDIRGDDRALSKRHMPIQINTIRKLIKNAKN